MSKTNMPGESFNELRRRVASHWPIKLSLLIGLTIFFTVPYVYLAHHPFFPARRFELTFLDRAAGFDPRWVWIYQSVYLLTGSLPWLAQRREELRRYLIGFGWLVGISFPIFIFFPVEIPRPLIENASGMYRLLLLYDGRFNAFPSLHIGFLYFTLAFFYRTAPRPSRIAQIVLIGWSGLIAWSTLATKEHYAVDLLAGLVVGIICDLAAWRRIFRTSGDASQAGFK